MRLLKAVFAVFLCFTLVPALLAQGTSQDTGAIRGIVKDKDGVFLPGVNILVTSPAIMGSQSAVTNEGGAFRLPLLRVGVYTLTASVQGFKTYKREAIRVALAGTVTLNIELLQASIEEEVTVTASSPVVDVKSSQTSKYFKADLLQNIPIGRNLESIVTLAPGVVSASSVKGGTAANTIYHVDGLYANDPDNAQGGTNLDFNIMEEVEIVTGGMQAEVGIATGGYVNAVTRSGGNKFSGLLQGFYNREPWTTVVVPEDQLRALGLGLPAVAIYAFDLSGSVGGPIIKDKIWFFSNGRYGGSVNRSGFVPWKSPLGVSYTDFNRENSNWGAMGKLTLQPAKKLRITFNGNYRAAYATTRASGLYMPYDCTYADSPWANTNAFGSLTYIVDPNTFLEARVGYLEVSAMLLLPDPSQSGANLDIVPHNYDRYTGYWFGTGDRTNEWIGRPSVQTSAHLTRFQDGLFGGDHEFKAGFELNTGACNWSDWQGTPLIQYWYNGSPYYWRGLNGLSGPDPLHGDGQIALYVMGQSRENSMSKSRALRLSGYLQDSWTINNRLTINVGLRYDYTKGWIPDIYKERTAGIAYSVGQATMLPEFGVNLYDEIRQAGVDPFVKWDIVSPRLGLTYDLFGDGKTAVKFSLGRYSDWLYASLIVSYNPLRLSSYTFDWWDDNGNGIPDNAGIDRYAGVWSTSPQSKMREYWSRLTDKNLKATYDDQITIGIDRELFANFKFSLNYLFKKKMNIIDDALYDFNTGQFFYKPDSGYWVPFTTTVPAQDQYPAKTVTMYFMKSSAPQLLRMLTNIPDAYRKYSGLDIVFEKRLAFGWQLGGSVTISKTWGNIAGDYGNIWGYALPGNNANWYVNNDGRLPGEDRNLVIKLFGTFNLPFGILSSFYYNFYTGTPWQRSVTVYAPTAWANANGIDRSRAPSYSINIESQGVRRNYTYQNVDFRLEKSFGIGKFGSISAYLDIYNLLGNYYVNVTQNPGGTWRPTDNNVSTGTYAVGSTYKRVTSISGLTRVFRFSLRYGF
ncbi:MAG: TonB-dependent receptor [Candidatus Aminicenantes bacterium]|nr:TonB-dependent receptor [Candidatus Aminicenantes bacterium]